MFFDCPVKRSVVHGLICGKLIDNRLKLIDNRLKLIDNRLKLIDYN